MLVRRSALYVIGRIVPGLVSMGLTALLTRILTPFGYGMYGVATLIMTVGANFLFDWQGVALVRIYAGARRIDDTLKTFLQIFLLLAVLLICVMALAALLLVTDPRDRAACLVGALLVIAYSGFELTARLRTARFEAGRYLVMNLVRSLLIMACAVPIALMTGDGLWTAAGTGLGMAAATLLGGLPIGLSGLLRLDRRLARDIIAYGLPIGLSMVLSGMVNSGARALLGATASPEALGYYTAGFVLIQNTLTMVASGIEAAAFPLAVAAVERGDEAAARDQLVRNASLLLAVLAPAALGMALTAPGIAHSLVGARFEPDVARLIPWMAAAGLLLNLRTNYLEHAFQLGQKPLLQVWVTAVSGGLAVLLAAMLIPRDGAVGAAIAVTIAGGVGCIHALLAGRYAFHLPVPTGQVVRILTACAAMALVVLAVPAAAPFGFVLQVLGGASAYGLAAFALDVLGARRRAWAWLSARRRSA
jgi:O-antigen/teichoic acid export membrane protein